MAHTQVDRDKLKARLARIRGQLAGVGRALDEERDCGEVLQQVAAIRGAVSGLMAELLEGHVRGHLAAKRIPAADRERAADDVVRVLRSYLR